MNTWPAKWPHPRTRKRDVAVLAILAAAVPGSVVVGVIGLSDGRPQVLAFGILIAVLFALAFVYHLLHSARPQRCLGDISVTRNRDGEAVTRIRRSPVLFHLRTALMAGLTVLFTASAVDHYFAEEGTAAVLGTLIYILIAVFFGSYLLAVATRGLAPGYVDLSPHGIVNRGWSFEAHMPWRNVLTVQAEHDRNHPQVLVIGDPERAWKHDYTVRLWRIDRLTVVPMLDIDTRKFRIPPEVLYQALSHYFDSADSRRELGTQASVDRFSRWWPVPVS
ncbi:hypothetical protein ONR57_09725 [Hoyosella sp. YIM 151337]|uniref:hypothetical protein n=1 Tax=Hoyosella sp. YIM 151337 TaxID=2992742 RepID=UPI002235E7DB|nr:hypothetical protein [Hoyosella sp. YIM 151337]MCW4353573.1 hypothetical protein [Hoyosella sp. YIM 151337]